MNGEQAYREVDDDRMPVLSGEVELVARIPAASNETFLASIGDVPVVYKPREGEKPLMEISTEYVPGSRAAKR